MLLKVDSSFFSFEAVCRDFEDENDKKECPFSRMKASFPFLHLPAEGFPQKLPANPGDAQGHKTWIAAIYSFPQP